MIEILALRARTPRTAFAPILPLEELGPREVDLAPDLPSNVPYRS